MKTMARFFFLTLCALTLSGCVDRTQADATLAKGCAAGAASLLPEGSKLGAIRNTEFSPSPEGPNMRHVALTAVTMDGYLEQEVTYQCIFEESFGLMKMNYTAAIYQVRVNDQIYGKSGNKIQGSFDDFIKLTDAIRKAMY
jgi:hypothetical protein